MRSHANGCEVFNGPIRFRTSGSRVIGVTQLPLSAGYADKFIITDTGFLSVPDAVPILTVFVVVLPPLLQTVLRLEVPPLATPPPTDGVLPVDDAPPTDLRPPLRAPTLFDTAPPLLVRTTPKTESIALTKRFDRYRFRVLHRLCNHSSCLTSGRHYRRSLRLPVSHLRFRSELQPFVFFGQDSTVESPERRSRLLSCVTS
jgi:hypothetical protein